MFLDEFHPSEPPCLFKIWKFTKAIRPNIVGGNNSLRQYIHGTKFHFLNRQAGSNLWIFWGFTLRRLFKKSIRCVSILALLEQRRTFRPLLAYCGNGNRLLTQKWHVQIAYNLPSPQSQTKAQLLSSSRPPSFFVTIYRQYNGELSRVQRWSPEPKCFNF